MQNGKGLLEKLPHPDKNTVLSLIHGVIEHGSMLYGSAAKR
jgi:hypothetical protein